MTQIKPKPFVGKPGKLPAKKDHRDFNFSNYFDANKLGKIPTAINWASKKNTPWGMMNNWTLSDCTCAAAGHMIECWTSNSYKEHIIHNKAIMVAYSAISGYDAVTGKNNIPVYISDALKYWRKTGVGNHKIKFYATINYKSHNLVRATIYLFGGIYVGLDLPNTIKGQEIWTVMPGKLKGDSARGSFGGHAVNVVAYDKNYITCISWGKIKRMTWQFWDTYCDELYAIISEDFFNENKNPLGLEISKLELSLLRLTKAKKTLQKELTIKTTIVKNTKKTTSKKEVVSNAKKPAGNSGGHSGSTGSEASKKTKAAPIAVLAKVAPAKGKSPIAVVVKATTKKAAVTSGGVGGSKVSSTPQKTKAAPTTVIVKTATFKNKLASKVSAAGSAKKPAGTSGGRAGNTGSKAVKINKSAPSVVVAKATTVKAKSVKKVVAATKPVVTKVSAVKTTVKAIVEAKTTVKPAVKKVAASGKKVVSVAKPAATSVKAVKTPEKVKSITVIKKIVPAAKKAAVKTTTKTKVVAKKKVAATAVGKTTI